MDRRQFALTLSFAWATAPLIAQSQAQRRPPNVHGLHPSLPDAVEHFNRRRWDRLSTLVRSFYPQSACALIDDMGDAIAIDANMDGLAREPMGATIAGGLLVNWGWRIRGTGFGSSVDGSAFSQFQARLAGAHDALNAALVSDANDGVAAAFLIRTEKGRQDLAATDEAFRRFEEASRRPIMGYSGYADAISGKWYGSQQRMLGFARQHQGSLAPSSRGLIPQAHNEAMLSFVRSSEPETEARAGHYFSTPFVRAEIVAANDAFHAVALDVDAFANLYAYGQFSFALMQMGEPELARPHVVGMGQSPAGPWSLLPDPDAALRRLRQVLGLADL